MLRSLGELWACFVVLVNVASIGNCEHRSYYGVLGPRYAAALERRNSYGVHWHCHSKESELGWSG